MLLPSLPLFNLGCGRTIQFDVVLSSSWLVALFLWPPAPLIRTDHEMYIPDMDNMKYLITASCYSNLQVLHWFASTLRSNSGHRLWHNHGHCLCGQRHLLRGNLCENATDCKTSIQRQPERQVPQSSETHAALRRSVPLAGEAHLSTQAMLNACSLQWWPYTTQALWSLVTPIPFGMVIIVVVVCNLGGLYNAIVYTIIRRRYTKVSGVENNSAMQTGNTNAD